MSENSSLSVMKIRRYPIRVFKNILREKLVVLIRLFVVRNMKNCLIRNSWQ